MQIALSILAILISGILPIGDVWAQSPPEGENQKEYALFSGLKTF